MKQLRKSVAVIIPIFNAYTSIRILLQSLTKQLHNLSDVQLILVNDASTDPRVWPMLQKFGKDHERITLLRNKINLGYTKSVHIGINAGKSTCDIVLLNSDTLIFEEWIHGLQKAAYSRTNIASVNPVTNNCIYASTLNWPIGKKITLAEARRYQKNLQKDRPVPNSLIEVTSTFGFCMYIKRSAWKKIGTFDTNLFPRGYGEEVEWCFRASRLGFIHCLTSEVFIFHKGSGSFLMSEKNQNNLRANKILKFKYPAEFLKFRKQLTDKKLGEWISRISMAHEQS